MANIVDPSQIKQILILHSEGLSNRKIAQILCLSRNTINQYVRWIKASEYVLQELVEQPTETISSLFPSHTTIRNERYNELMYYIKQMQKVNKHSTFTFSHHYVTYRQTVQNPYGYTQFLEHYRRKCKHEKNSTDLEYHPGKKVFMHFVGNKLTCLNKETGEIEPVEVFVAMLPYSQYTYVEACKIQQKKDLIKCIENMLRFFEGVPIAILSDNLLGSLSIAGNSETELKHFIKDLALHYNCIINPSKTFQLQDKALVDNVTSLTYQRIYHSILGMPFFSIKGLNDEISINLESFNNMLFQNKSASRKELYQSIEKEVLKSLSGQEYKIKDYTNLKVQKIGYIYLSADKKYYSVPYCYIGRNVNIHCTPETVEVYYHNERITVHDRDAEKGKYITIRQHLGSTHRQYGEWSPQYFKDWARNCGLHVLKCVNAIFINSKYPETAYKGVLGILNMGKIYGKKNLNSACERVLLGDIVSYSRIKNILKNNLDMFAEE